MLAFRVTAPEFDDERLVEASTVSAEKRRPGPALRKKALFFVQGLATLEENENRSGCGE